MQPILLETFRYFTVVEGYRWPIIYLIGFHLLLEPPFPAWLLLVVAPAGPGSFPLRARSTRWQCNGKNLPCRGGKGKFHPQNHPAGNFKFEHKTSRS